MKAAVEEANKGRKGVTILQNKDLLHLINDVSIALITQSGFSSRI